ncbi:Hpt domain-containing protein [Pseudotabrizicola alkalilacus]|uniref:Hpt domain-containing protein n=1 Tax=Pseudotabrizicola alkalilacus TaxID=2305252 RepID=A0A411Z057_9RHOB|nr:Hpt domain-containing protein [Pseudotabrizicola alkalilacus]RGP36437.1 Hpt domain-containing protein [Pseudotabrizicola alkalilacus]
MIDWDRVAELKQTIGTSAFAEVVTLFLDEADQSVAGLGDASTAGQMQAAFHALKGTALTLGFTDLSEIARSCESRAESGDTDLPLAEVQAVYTRSRAAFVQQLPTLTA